MKRNIPLLILLFISMLHVSAQEKVIETTEKETIENPRVNRNFAFTSESGFKSLSGFGLNGSYYIKPQIAVDLGVGIGLQLFKGGIRGRYLFLDKKFSPYAGLGLFLNPIPLNEVLFFSDSNGYDVIIKSSAFGQAVIGAEFMADIGFVFGFNAGYALSLSGENWRLVDGSLGDTDISALNYAFNSSLSFAFNIGWAF